jgi:hypothetical protein
MSRLADSTGEELNAIQIFERDLFAQEDQIIHGVSIKLVKAILFLTTAKMIARTVSAEEILNLKAKIGFTFQGIKCAVTARPTGNEIVPLVWQEGSAVQPFWARVWADFRQRQMEIEVTRKEFVKVLKVLNHGYSSWKRMD